MNPQIWWFAARSGGIVAWALATVSVCWGLMLSTKAANKASPPARLLDLHRFLGGSAVIFTGIHVAGLVADSYIQFGWLEVLVPWTSAWEPWAVAWGVIAAYLLVAIEVTSLFMKRLPRSVWKQVHRSSFGLYVFATYHGITAGTDTGNDWYRMAMLASINVVAFLTVLTVLAHRPGKASAARPPAAQPHQDIGAGSVRPASGRPARGVRAS